MCRFFKTNKNTFSIDFANIIYFFISQISFTFFTRYRLNIFLFFQKKYFFFIFRVNYKNLRDTYRKSIAEKI